MDSSDHNYPQIVDASNLCKRLPMGQHVTHRPRRNVASSSWAVKLSISDTILQIYLLRKQEKHKIAYIRRRIRKGLPRCSLRQSRKIRWISYHKAPCMQNEGCSSEVNQYSEVGTVRSRFSCLLMKSCSQAFSKTRFKVYSIHPWSDSTITLAWISGEPGSWNTFVSNRVSDIIDVTSPSDWKHVPT